MYNQLEFRSGQELVEQYAPLVKRIAYHLMARLPSTVILDDLIQAGMLGLLEAMSKYDPGEGCQFRDLCRYPHPRRHHRRGAARRLDAPFCAP